MNREAAEERVQTYNDKVLSVDIGYCPLISRYCDHNCVCYREAEMIITGIDKGVTNYQVTLPHCGNAMFSGERK